jgi:hypothetical protein
MALPPAGVAGCALAFLVMAQLWNGDMAFSFRASEVLVLNQAKPKQTGERERQFTIAP